MGSLGHSLVYLWVLLVLIVIVSQESARRLQGLECYYLMQQWLLPRLVAFLQSLLRPVVRQSALVLWLVQHLALVLCLVLALVLALKLVLALQLA